MAQEASENDPRTETFNNNLIKWCTKSKLQNSFKIFKVHSSQGIKKIKKHPTMTKT